MKSMSVSEFEATCLAALERVRRTRQPLRVTRYGKPIADVVPPAPDPREDDWMGSMQGSLRVRGDIVAPVADENEWESIFAQLQHKRLAIGL